jgi:hypothetical protein
MQRVCQFIKFSYVLVKYLQLKDKFQGDPPGSGPLNLLDLFHAVKKGDSGRLPSPLVLRAGDDFC